MNTAVHGGTPLSPGAIPSDQTNDSEHDVCGCRCIRLEAAFYCEKITLAVWKYESRARQRQDAKVPSVPLFQADRLFSSLVVTLFSHIRSESRNLHSLCTKQSGRVSAQRSRPGICVLALDYPPGHEHKVHIHFTFVTTLPGVCHDAEYPSAGLGPTGEFWPLSPALSRSHGGPYHPVLLLRKRGVRASVRGTAGGRLWQRF